MLSPVPNIEDYGITGHHGFLPAELPLEILPDPYYTKWEAVVTNLQALLLSRRLREVIKKLPVLSTSRLQCAAEWRRAYLVLAFMTHGYIWGGDLPEEVCLGIHVQSTQADCTNRESHHRYQSLSSKSANTLSSLLWRRMLAFVSGILSPYSLMSQ